jgi:hypothetical protein
VCHCVCVWGGGALIAWWEKISCCTAPLASTSLCVRNGGWPGGCIGLAGMQVHYGCQLQLQDLQIEMQLPGLFLGSWVVGLSTCRTCRQQLGPAGAHC